MGVRLARSLAKLREKQQFQHYETSSTGMISSVHGEIEEDTKVVLIGHSNGGQGVWYMASRYPDRVLAGYAFRFLR